jgi:cell division protein FtsW
MSAEADFDFPQADFADTPRAPAVPLDRTLLLATLLLLGLGLVLVYSSSSIYAGRLYQDPHRFLRSQSVFAGLGLISLWGAAQVPRQFLQRRGGWLWLVAMLSCAAVLVPGIGHFVGGARRWLLFMGVSCQPSEFCKLALVVVLAALLAKRAVTLPRRGLWLPFVLVQAPVALILCEPDLGTALVIEQVMVVMLFAAGLRARTLLTLGACSLPILYHLIVGTPFRLRRVMSYVDPWAYRSTTGYQVTEALISIGSGGLWGSGLGEGKQKLFFLPEAHTDFIFAVLAEELGFVGVALLVAAFAVLVGRAIYLATLAQQPFDQFLAMGVAALIGIPAVFNTCVATGLLPTKGLPLPFISYGGSNLLISLTAVGLLLRVARDVRAERLSPQENAW